VFVSSTFGLLLLAQLYATTTITNMVIITVDRLGVLFMVF
jgi:hypothetical protein